MIGICGLRKFDIWITRILPHLHLSQLRGWVCIIITINTAAAAGTTLMKIDLQSSLHSPFNIILFHWHCERTGPGLPLVWVFESTPLFELQTNNSDASHQENIDKT